MYDHCGAHISVHSLEDCKTYYISSYVDMVTLDLGCAVFWYWVKLLIRSIPSLTHKGLYLKVTKLCIAFV